MQREEFFAKEFERYRSEFHAGNPVALNEAVLLAIWNNVPVPKWAVPQLEAIVKMHAEGRFGRKQGVAAPLVIEERNREAAAIYQKVEWLMSLDDSTWLWYSGGARKTKTTAFDVAAEIFRDAGNRYGDREKAQINRDAIKNSYYAVQRAIRSGNGAKYGLVQK